MKSLREYITNLNVVFAVELIVIFLAVLGVLPREAFLFLLGLFLYFVLFSSFEESVLLTIRSVPFFVALPITDSFDSLNTWRIIVLVLFLKLLLPNNFFFILDAIFKIIKKAKTSLKEAFFFAYNNFKIETLSFLLFLTSLASLAGAQDLIAGIKRIIYFLNLAMLFFIVRQAARMISFDKITKNLLIPVFLVVLIGFFQLYLSYVMPINNFVEFWALQFDRVFYGNSWAGIVINANTWFAYYGSSIHLRLFSSFPDTHSYPLYLLMGFVFLATATYKKYAFGKNITWYMFFWISLLFAIILTGTRGIWASFIFPVVLLGFWYFKKYVPKDFLRFLSLPFLIFLILLPLSAPIFASEQFNIKVKEEDKARIFAERFKSIIDTEETSNSGRIYIWTQSAKSIIKHPLLGVGIGNFPTVLKENISATKAGASAHNLYLHIAAELGFLGALVFLLILIEIFKESWMLFKKDYNNTIKFFGLFSCLVLSWILGYLMTDVAIFDERAFLMLMVLLGVIFSFAKKENGEPSRIA